MIRNFFVSYKCLNQQCSLFSPFYYASKVFYKYGLRIVFWAAHNKPVGRKLSMTDLEQQPSSAAFFSPCVCVGGGAIVNFEIHQLFQVRTQIIFICALPPLFFYPRKRSVLICNLFYVQLFNFTYYLKKRGERISVV